MRPSGSPAGSERPSKELTVSDVPAAVKAVIAGRGPYGYIVAMQAALQGAGKLPASLPPAVRVGPK